MTTTDDSLLIFLCFALLVAVGLATLALQHYEQGKISELRSEERRTRAEQKRDAEEAEEKRINLLVRDIADEVCRRMK